MANSAVRGPVNRRRGNFFIVRAWKGDSPHDHEIATTMPARLAATLLRSRRCRVRIGKRRPRRLATRRSPGLRRFVDLGENNEGARVGRGASPPGIYSRPRLPRAWVGRGLLLPRSLSSPFLPPPARSGYKRIDPPARPWPPPPLRGGCWRRALVRESYRKGRPRKARHGAARSALRGQLALGRVASL